LTFSVHFSFFPNLSSTPAKTDKNGQTDWLAGFNLSIFGISVKTIVGPKPTIIVRQKPTG
jgi:hypothetical protein